MNSLHRYKEAEFQRVVEKLLLVLRLMFPDKEIETAFAELSLSLPDKEVCMHVRRMCVSETDKKMHALCKEYSAKFETEPRPRDITALLDSSGYKYSRNFAVILLKMIKVANSQRWTAAVGARKKVVRLAEGELAMWDALQRTYALRSDMLVPTLLRLFAVVTSSGKVDPLEVSYLTSSMTDKELKRYAQSLNFTVQHAHKPRA
jgi:hypothetical protein